MGWTFTSELRLSGKSKKDYVDGICTWEGERDGVPFKAKPLKSVFVGSTYYAAIERLSEDGSCEVFAVVFLTSSKPNDPDGYTFGYKDMDETVGLCSYDCPASILDLLTPTDHQYAAEWRAACRERAKLTGRKLKDGDIIELPEAIEFTDGTQANRFTVRKVKYGRRTRTELRIEGRAGGYKIHGLMKRAWTKLPPVPSASTFFGA